MTTDADADREIVAWMVPLEGHEFDLEDLPIYLEGSPVSVTKRDGQYFLVISTGLVGTTHENVPTAVNEYVTLINGLRIMLSCSGSEIRMNDGPYFGVNGSGLCVSTIIRVRAAEIRIKGGHGILSINGVAVPDGRMGAMSRLLQKVLGDSANADAVSLIGRQSPSWAELYVVLELVKGSVGRRMYDAGWITKAEAISFTRTANSYTALGRRGRHGKDSGETPAVPMLQQRAVALMRRLVSAWIVSDAGNELCAGQE